MQSAATTETKPFNGKRIVVHTSRGFDDVLKRLKSVMGSSTVGEVVELAKAHAGEADFARRVNEQLVGTSDFMLFHVIDHSGWLPIYGIKQRTVRWIIGNPLLAVTMIRHDITAGLFAPVELLVTENADGSGSTITYVLPSSLMVIEDNPPLLAASVVLDEKLAALVAGAANA
jgi:uncharacterized protein DUF302